MGDIMSFIYAEKGVDKVDNQGLPYLFIYGDTKFTPVPGAPNIKNWGKRTFEIVSRYGLVKSMIVAPKCCVSFAGNDISYPFPIAETGDGIPFLTAQIERSLSAASE